VALQANAGPIDAPWMWTLAFGHHEDRTPTHGYEATRVKAAMAAFAKLAAGVTQMMSAFGAKRTRTLVWLRPPRS
jgi:hypothetical protein